MKNLVIILLFSLFSLLCKAQQADRDSIDMDTVYVPRHAIYLELGGNAVVYSLNYERFIFQGKTIQLSLRFGGGYYAKTIFTPLMINTIIGRKRHKVEVDIGVTGQWDIDFDRRKRYDELIKNGQTLPSPYRPLLLVRPTGTIAYRFQSKSGIYYKVGFTLLYEMVNYSYSLAPWGNIGIGYLFGYTKTNTKNNY